MDALYAFPSLPAGDRVLVPAHATSSAAACIAAAAVPDRDLHPAVLPGRAQHDGLSAKEATYVEAARAIGAPRRHHHAASYLFGNVIQSVPVLGTLNAADAIRTLAGLGFLGLGHPADRGRRVGLRPEPGARRRRRPGSGGPALYPGLAIVLLVTGLTLVGEGLNETLNPALRRRRLLPVVMPPRERGHARPGGAATDMSHRPDRRRPSPAAARSR